MTVKELKVNDKVYEPDIEFIREHKISSIHSSDDLNHVNISFCDRLDKITDPFKQHVNSTKVVFKGRYSSYDTTCYTTLDKAKRVRREMRLKRYSEMKDDALLARQKADEFYSKYLND